MNENRATNIDVARNCDKHIYLAPSIHYVFWFLLQWLTVSAVAWSFLLLEGTFTYADGDANKKLIYALVITLAILFCIYLVWRRAVFTIQDVCALGSRYDVTCEVKLKKNYIDIKGEKFNLIGSVDRPYWDFRPYSHHRRTQLPDGSYKDIWIGGFSPRYMHNMSTIFVWRPIHSQNKGTENAQLHYKNGLVRFVGNIQIGIEAPLFGKQRFYVSGDYFYNFIVMRNLMGISFSGGSWLGRKFCEQIAIAIKLVEVIEESEKFLLSPGDLSKIDFSACQREAEAHMSFLLSDKR